MEGFDHKTIVTTRDLTYSYFIKRKGEGKPALLLQHGFPDDHALWEPIIPYLLDLPFSIIVPDLLGYGGTSKPSDPHSYNSRDMSRDLVEILDKEGFKYAISVGHDWGSVMASRMVLWHPDRIVGLIILNVAYYPPRPMDIKQANDMMEQTTGLRRLSYQEFFVKPDAHKLIEDRLESMWCAAHGVDDGDKILMEELFCHPDAMESYLRADKRTPLKGYAQNPAFRQAWIDRMRRDGFQGPLNWYHAAINNEHWRCENELPSERSRLDVPVLFIGCDKDKVCLTPAIEVSRQAGLLPDLTVREVSSGHWQTFEVPDQTGPIIVEWLKGREADLVR